MTGFWRELKRANKERIRQDNARAREAKRLDKIQQAKTKLAITLARNGEGAMPSGSRIRVKEGSGSPMGSENSRSVRKRFVRSRVEHPTEKTLPVGSKGQKKQRGSMGNLTPKPTKFTGDAPAQTFQGAKRQAYSALCCTNCGNTLKPTAKFCGSCGTRTA